MLQWYRETYAVTAADQASALVMHYWTPSGVLHDSITTRALSQRQDWLVHSAQVYVLRTTSGYIKQGVMGQIAVCAGAPGLWLPILTNRDGVCHANFGMIQAGAPFRATHGVGWVFYQGALVDTDKVVMKLLYEPLGPIGAER